MIAPPIPLVWAKLQPPRLAPETIDRVRLIDRLTADGAALTAIVAPAGYGKTTVAAQLADRLAGGRAWLSLERADDEPVRFWTYVAAALGSAGVDGTDDTYALLAAGAAGVADASLSLRSAVENHPGAMTLVLDDMHTLADPVIDETLGDWLRHPLRNLRVICTSRSDLQLPVGRLRSQGLLTEARLDDLMFNGDESAALLTTTFGIRDLTAGQLDALLGRTEGWPVGLYLAGLTLRDSPDVELGLARLTGDTRHLQEYLAAEAMDGISDHQRAFVLATSILPILYPDLCDMVTDMTGSLRTLRELAADNMFISALDDAATVFRYHPLFREHLRSTLDEQHPEQVAELHARACDWHDRRGEAEPAIEHATAAGQIERAEHLILEGFLAFANAGHFGTVAAWIDALGPHEERTSETATAMSWLSLNLRRYDAVEHWLEIASTNARTSVERDALGLQRPAVLVHRARHAGDVGDMQTHARTALAAAHAEVGDGTRFAAEGRAAALSAAASAAYWAGRADDAVALATQALASRTGSMLIEQTFCYQYLAIIAADRDDLHAALAHADQALAHVDRTLEATVQPTLAHLARSVALAGLGRVGDAADALVAARRAGSHRREPLSDAAIELHQARLHHTTGDQEAARAAVRAARAIVDDLPDPRFDDRIRAAENAIRFVAADADALPVGARELTERELAVLRLLPHRLSRRELAQQLHVSENTVKSHLTSIRHKLGISGRASIVDRAVELGLLADVAG